MALSDIAAAGPTGPQHQHSRKAYPDGWQPRSEVDDVDGGFVVSRPMPTSENVGDFAAVLDEFGLNPAQWSVERVRRSRWQRWDGEWLESVRLSILPARATQAARVDLDALVKVIAKFRPRTTTTNSAGDRSVFVAPIGDTQIGKSDNGGTAAAVPRVLAEIERGAQRYRALAKTGRAGDVILPQLGDCIEGSVSQGGAVVGRTDIGVTEQVRIYRRLLWAQVKAYATAPTVRVPVVPGNHDEARRMPATTFTDSWAIEAASAVQDAVQQNPELSERVRFIFPEHDELTVTIDAGGTVLGMAHGHQFRGGWAKWWDAQAGGRQPIGDADVLLAGHLHHLHVQDHGGRRVFIQVPALDGGSSWFRHQHGQDSPSRAVTFLTEGGHVTGLDPVL